MSSLSSLAPRSGQLHHPSSIHASVPRAVVFAMALLAGTTSGAESSSPTLEALRASDEAFHRAAMARDRGAAEEHLAEDVVFFADELLRGRQAFLDGWAPLWQGKYDFTFSAGLLRATVADSGDLGFTIGDVETRFQHPVETEPSVTGGHYLNVWSRSQDGRWKLRASGALVVHPELGAARDPRSGLMTAWPELADQIDARIEIRWLPERTERAASGELALTLGSYTAAFGEGPDRRAGEGHFLAVWQRDDSGSWQLAAESFTPPAIEIK